MKIAKPLTGSDKKAVIRAFEVVLVLPGVSAGESITYVQSASASLLRVGIVSPI